MSSSDANPLVTVVVPVYNVAPYLDRCLASVAGQDYSRLEIVVVDDGSTDGSGAMCDTWARRDSRIAVIHKPNGGLSSARNAALDVMTGQCVTMVDSDDWLQPDAIGVLLALMTDTGADVAVGGWREVYESDTTPAGTTRPGRRRTYTAAEALDAIYYQRGLTHSAWGRIYRAALFDGLRYPEGLLYEDLAVAYDLYSRVGTVAQCAGKYYNYLQRPTSILGTFNRRRTHVLDILDTLERRVTAERPALLAAVRSRRLSACFNILRLCPPGDELADVRRRCWQGITSLRGGCLRDPRVRPKNHLGILASYLGRSLFTALFARH